MGLFPFRFRRQIFSPSSAQESLFGGAIVAEHRLRRGGALLFDLLTALVACAPWRLTRTKETPS